MYEKSETKSPELFMDVMYPNGEPECRVSVRLGDPSTVYGITIEKARGLIDYCLKNPTAYVTIISSSERIQITGKKLLKIIGENCRPVECAHPNGLSNVPILGLRETSVERLERLINADFSQHLSTS